MSSYAHVVHTTAKQVISRRRKNENVFKKKKKILFFIVKYANLWGFCCRRRRGCLSSLMKRFLTTQVTRKTIFWRNLLTGKYSNNESITLHRCPQGHWNHRKPSSSITQAGDLSVYNQLRYRLWLVSIFQRGIKTRAKYTNTRETRR